ncbi:2-polyprenyl-6-methoxyphenol hydroxylase-like FAD-dependent oxidoreductase [Stackebrandtia albiflava]|uniref:2-polyprenyl-6-methoxyphenol hydroxylase-like FAD-dependent oxidoreductase n=1 Tax=Stackebrandtia albiflava TaxID=406432 RepID=A0A562V439_9ACTN|nr:FAD-dependent monooxygenase [Stackebrandtia albiflava]TWJ12592.1 2-polyprenyl-6-methoxyphenol hydroxylase-like FAD-dependent oxidoreductase [Stackebrandtia albiflava]
MTHVLVSGASIAGLTTAHWLRRHGFTVTVVEKAPGLRSGGQAIDIRGVALTVVERMGILEQIRQHVTGFRGMTVVDADGRELMSTTEETFSGGRLDGEDLELFRDDLNEIIHGTLDDGIEFRFADSIAAITQTGSRTHVTFESGLRRDFDIVVGADGLHSHTRRIAFGPESDYIRSLHAHIGIFSIPNYLGLDRWQVMQHLGDTTAMVYTTRRPGGARAIIGFKDEDLEYDHRDVALQRRLLAAGFAGIGWEVPRLLELAAEAPDFYFDTMAQIHMPAWSTGRVGLVGDAAYCGSPLTGQGTSLALVGGYVPAGELAAAAGDPAGLRAYETEMREYVRLNQRLAVERNPDNSPVPELMAAAVNGIDVKDYRTVRAPAGVATRPGRGRRYHAPSGYPPVESAA